MLNSPTIKQERSSYYFFDFCTIFLVDDGMILYWQIEIKDKISTVSMRLKDLVAESQLTDEQKDIVNQSLFN